MKDTCKRLKKDKKKQKYEQNCHYKFNKTVFLYLLSIFLKLIKIRLKIPKTCFLIFIENYLYKMATKIWTIFFSFINKIRENDFFSNELILIYLKNTDNEYFYVFNKIWPNMLRSVE
jgi:hypothetical protein